MICGRCLRRASCLRNQFAIARSFTSTPYPLTPAVASSSPNAEPNLVAATTSVGVAQPISAPLSPSRNDVSLGVGLRQNPRAVVIPVSSVPAGTPLKGLNYLKGRDDPIALPEEEYPEWLWRCLDVKKPEGEVDGDVGDEFSKSKKLRRKAAKRDRKLQARLLASGDNDALTPKIPLQQQSIDLPFNEKGNLQGGLEAVEKREEIRQAMRRERRAKIKESNFLKGM